MKHYELMEFLSNLNVKRPLYERKAPPHKRKTPLLTTFWRRFWKDICPRAQHFEGVTWGWNVT